MKLNKILLVSSLVLLCLVVFLKKESFSSFAHRSYLSSTYWISKPQVQHTFPDLGLQYPDHEDYFKNSCNEKEPENAELCRYHKHRFDPAQL